MKKKRNWLLAVVLICTAGVSQASDIALSPDHEVWLTPDDVASGVDTVVDAALAWIESENGG